MDKLSKQIKRLEGEISSVNERITNTAQSIEQTEILIKQLESELREVRVASCLEPSLESKSIIAGIKIRLEAAKNDKEEFEILQEALAGRKGKLNAELEALQVQAKQDEAKRLAEKLPGLISQYNEGIKLAFQASIAAKALDQRVMESGGKQFIHEIDSRGFNKIRVMMDKFVLADFKEGCSEPYTLNIDTCDKKVIIDALLS